jgi:hypothetical protein
MVAEQTDVGAQAGAQSKSAVDYAAISRMMRR